MVDYVLLIASSFINESHNPYTTKLLHPDGAFFALLCLFSWVLFLTLWAWNHKPPKRTRSDDRQRRTQEWKIPEHWKN